MEEHCKQQNEAISPLLTKEDSGKEVVEEPQKLILNPLSLGSLLAAPSTYLVYILPTPATQSIPEAPAAKAEASPFAPLMQNYRKLVVIVQTFSTTLKTLAAAHVAWHSG